MTEYLLVKHYPRSQFTTYLHDAKGVKFKFLFKGTDLNTAFKM